MKFIFQLLCLALLMACSSIVPVAQTSTEPLPRHPKLIIGITVDQMRYDYIEKYWNDFGNGGFRKLANDGFFCRNLHYNYMPTYTGPGHASIYTGTTPAYHGIIANDWYRKAVGDTMYCAKDLNVNGVGTISSGGKMSPIHLLATTMGDELKIFSNERSKIIGVAMKDRGAILPAGRRADAAYWFVGKNEGVWATSSWYMDDLPDWVKQINTEHEVENYLHRGWDLLKDVSAYDESMADNNPYEAPFKGTIRPVFPYNLDSLRAMNGDYELIKTTPWSNTMTVNFAKSAIENEQLGEDEFTDMLCMSFSGTDYIGHQFGIHSREIQDCYLRLDQDIAEFITYIETKFGKDNVLIFLTADHGGAPTPSYVSKLNDAAGYWKPANLVAGVDSLLDANFGPGNWVRSYNNDQLFINWSLLPDKINQKHSIENMVADFCLRYKGVYKTYTAHDLAKGELHDTMASMVQLGFSQKLSGDVMIVTDPGWIEYSLQGTTHGSPFSYDSHVPALFYGFGISHGETSEPYKISDIAPTICALSKLPFPNMCIGKPISQLVE